MDKPWPTRLFEFDGGVLEVYDYGDDPERGPGVYLVLFNRGEPATRELRLIEDRDDETGSAAS
ncbi:hypothetical protein NDR87_17855 [Nocardia sp. CDC159]|uniref:Uncharacterized protein n=1 Tax=Nocardia pulmonis TaxID=2951408 RepID=A0A9X2E7M2_9NOCA|nr:MULTISPECIES: hypothetical protein [Nocardia]MCM6775797.1 hypothetical protein [Nocardia pulmonis]MCM6788227.1 hypothetical protein [Nocardia sp. CDC159]